MLQQNINNLQSTNNKYKGLMRRIVAHTNLKLGHPLVDEMCSIFDNEN
ncbi:MAG: hypothetical protein ACOC2U_00575 [bacterium]